MDEQTRREMERGTSPPDPDAQGLPDWVALPDAREFAAGQLKARLVMTVAGLVLLLGTLPFLEGAGWTIVLVCVGILGALTLYHLWRYLGAVRRGKNHA